MMRYAARMPHALRRLMLLGSLLLLTGCVGNVALPEPLPVAPVAPFPANGDPPLLADAAWLQRRMAEGGQDLRIVDASPIRVYRAGHIPGAVHGWWQDTMDPNGTVFGRLFRPDENLPDPQIVRRVFLEDLGIDDGTAVVVYDDEHNRWAARMVWALRFIGHEQATVLDGGLAAWIGAGGEVQTGWQSPPEVSNPTVAPLTPQTDHYLTTSQLVPIMAQPDLLILDVRTEEELRDDIDETITPGRIPGAVAIPWTSTLRADGRLKDPAELRALFAAAGVTPDRRVVVTARFGVETAHTWLVLKLLGYPSVIIHDGGWMQWALDPALPKEALPPNA